MNITGLEQYCFWLAKPLPSSTPNDVVNIIFEQERLEAGEVVASVIAAVCHFSLQDFIMQTKFRYRTLLLQRTHSLAQNAVPSIGRKAWLLPKGIAACNGLGQNPPHELRVYSEHLDYFFLKRKLYYRNTHECYTV